MSLGLPEITLIVVIIVVLFGVTWVIKDRKRRSMGSANPAPTEPKKDDRKV